MVKEIPMAEIKLPVPDFLEGVTGDKPTTLVGIALAVTPQIMNYFYPGSAPAVLQVMGIIGGILGALTKGDTKPGAPDAS